MVDAGEPGGVRLPAFAAVALINARVRVKRTAAICRVMVCLL
jgi:hypothetical protein